MNNASSLFILAACFGALCQEILYWFELRKKLDDEDNKKVFKSKFYWTITLIVIVISGFGTWLLFYDDTPMKLKIPFVLGAAFPYLFKKIVQVTQDKELPHLGAETTPSFSDIAKKYFR
jgi:hypothetical protein